MCRYYDKDTCPNMKCDMVHEDDEQVHNVVPWTRLTVKKIGPSPKEMAEEKQRKKGKKQSEKCEMKTTYDLMFDRLDKSRKDGKDDSEDIGGSATA
jgi:hypothetical protein